MEGIESSGKEDKDMPTIKIKEDFLNAKKRGAKNPSLKDWLS